MYTRRRITVRVKYTAAIADKTMTPVLVGMAAATEKYQE